MQDHLGKQLEPSGTPLLWVSSGSHVSWISLECLLFSHWGCQSILLKVTTIKITKAMQKRTRMDLQCIGEALNYYLNLNSSFSALSRSRRPTKKVKEDPGLREIIEKRTGASLVAQWLRICLPMQGTQVRALVWEDPTYRGATRPVSHNY